MMGAGADNLAIVAWIDLGISGPLLLFMRMAAALGGLIAGWFLSGPIVRLLVRVAFHKPVPPNVLYGCKIGGAMLTALLIFWYLPLGTGGGGGGSGNGAGNGGPGDGKGSGPGNGDAAKKGGDDKSLGNGKRGTIAIEVIGGDRYKDDVRYYLLDRKEPAVSLSEVEAAFKDKRGRLQVVIVLTKDSVGERHGAVSRLQNLALKYDQFTLVKTEMPKSK